MKKETGIILFIVGIIVGFGAGMITTTAIQPSSAIRGTSAQSSQQGDLPPPAIMTPEALAAAKNADKQAAEKARLLDEIKQLKYALDQAPKNLEILISLGNNYFDVGQHYAAIEHYEKALKINPDLPNVLVDLGIMFRRTKKFDKAIETFDKALAINAKHENARLNKAVVYKYDLGDYEKSLELFSKFMEFSTGTHPMIDVVKQEIAFLKAELLKGNKGQGPNTAEDGDHDHPPGEGH